MFDILPCSTSHYSWTNGKWCHIYIIIKKKRSQLNGHIYSLFLSFLLSYLQLHFLIHSYFFLNFFAFFPFIAIQKHRTHRKLIKMIRLLYTTVCDKIIKLLKHEETKTNIFFLLFWIVSSVGSNTISASGFTRERLNKNYNEINGNKTKILKTQEIGMFLFYF